MHILENPIPITRAHRDALDVVLADSGCLVDYDLLKTELIEVFEEDLAKHGIVGSDLIGATVEYGYQANENDRSERAWPRFRLDADGWHLIGFSFAKVGPADEICIYTPATSDVIEVHHTFDDQPDRIVIRNAPSIAGPASESLPRRVH